MKIELKKEMTDIELIHFSKKSNAHLDHVYQSLSQKHRRLIVHTAHRYGNPYIGIEDRIAVCQLGFYEAIQSYDCVKTGNRFITTWLVVKMQGELRKLAFELFPWLNQPETNEAPLEICDIDKQIGNVYEDFSDGDSRITNPLQELIQKEAIAMIKKALERVSERDRFIYEHMLGLFGKDEMSGLELAEELEMTHQRIYQIFNSVSKEVWYIIQDNYKVHDWH